jgi:hypothetical protein
MMVPVPLFLIRQVATNAPAGYLDDCMAAGTVSDDGLIIRFPPDKFEKLLAKYQSLFAPVLVQQPPAVPMKGVRPPPPAAGPGTELKKLLALVGIQATTTCSCNKRAKVMDDKGPEWCAANEDTILGWLREEATKRKLPFVDLAGRLLIRRAIRNARRAAAS